MEKATWLITGAAGFIGSHLTENLLKDGHSVIGLDNFATGKRDNIEKCIGTNPANFRLIEGDIRNIETCLKACEGVNFILHHAAVASVPFSISNPSETYDTNVNGFLNILEGARKAKVSRIIYASSSAVYGDDPHLPKVESRLGVPLSPYAASKTANELYAATHYQVYGLKCVGLRYFNVFGPRQDPNGAYAAVVPKWLGALSQGKRPIIYGDGDNTRDFCYVKDIVNANICAATTENKRAFGNAFNIGLGKQTSLNELFDILKKIASPQSAITPIYEAFRDGDIRHSVADVELASSVLGFKPKYTLQCGLEETWRL